MKLKSILPLCAIATSLILLAGCSSPQKIETVDGRTIISQSKPEIDNDTGLVSYKDAETGKVEQINRDQVRTITELKD
ncbi:YgdI/YgdR family lipoprotein [Proteus myxofaciens]|uniref:Putative outer membrane lipoprotein n=1 Tax=Proteus myxofaciens ATCC 19692 TaxID=1354337 RepID=A0A198GFV1_9GAMM|nr:YgdI/YgdR family lipoprotein [Proteus myxofaciens]OAT35780.1 putative outer membrane lipoprotein [Proteus myxofaciens ATCC 19692]